MPHLPIELWIAILKNLDGDQDKPSLIACSSSCKTLLSPSYCQLYRHVTLSSATTANLFIRTITSQSLHPPATYVRRLFICCDDWNLQIFDLNSVIPILAQSLPAVTILRLVNECWSFAEFSPAAQSALSTGFQNVRELELSRIMFHTEDQMFEIFASFPSLTHLACFDGYHVPNPSRRLVPLPRGVKTIDISTLHLDAFYRLLCLEPHPDLHILRINFRDMRRTRVSAVGRLLKLLGPSLESLTFYGWAVTGWGHLSWILPQGPSFLLFPTKS
jgi:hypothetical protein